MKNSKFSISSTLFLLVISFSCQHELLEKATLSEAQLFKLQEAQNWFETNYSSKSMTAGRKIGVITSRWDKATVFENSVELPFTVDGKLQLPHSDYGLKKQGRKRLLVHKNNKGFSAYIISYIPSDKFEGDIKVINAASFKSLHFDGKISIQALGSDFIQEFTLQNGEPKKIDKVSTGGRIAVWNEQCTDWYQWGGSEWFFTDTTCDTWWETDYNSSAYSYSNDPTWPFYSDNGNAGGGPSYYVSNLYWLYCIQNQLQNPCLNITANNVLNPDLVSSYNKWIQEIFNSSDKVNLILQEGSLPADKVAATNPISITEGIIDITVILDPDKLVNGSREFIAATIYHECFHAIVKYLSDGNFSSDDAHIAMFTSRLNLLASGLDAAYSGMLPGDAKGLILSGLLAMDGGNNPTDPQKWSTDFVNKVLNYSGFSRAQVNAIYARYQVYKTSGTNCN